MGPVRWLTALLCASRAQAARPAAPRTATRPRSQSPTVAPPWSFVWAPSAQPSCPRWASVVFTGAFPGVPPLGVWARVYCLPLSSSAELERRGQCAFLGARGGATGTVAFSPLAPTGSDPHRPRARPGLWPGTAPPAACAALRRVLRQVAAPSGAGRPGPSR